MIIIDYIGSLAFCLSGALIAKSHKMDLFGIFVLSLVAGFGGGFIRDISLGQTPPVIFLTPAYWLIAVIATLFSLFFSFKNKWSDFFVHVGDTLGLAFFTIVGVKKGLEAQLPIMSVIMMGVITSCFGGVLRDVLVSRVPYIFTREVYATFSLFGGSLYLFLISQFDTVGWYAEVFVIALICVGRGLSIWKSWHLPKI